MKNSATSVNIGSRIPTHQIHARLTLAELVLAGAVTEAQADQLNVIGSTRKRGWPAMVKPFRAQYVNESWSGHSWLMASTSLKYLETTGADTSLGWKPSNPH